MSRSTPYWKLNKNFKNANKKAEKEIIKAKSLGVSFSRG